MAIFVYITLGQGHSNVSNTLLIIYEPFVLKSATDCGSLFLGVCKGSNYPFYV